MKTGWWLLDSNVSSTLIPDHNTLTNYVETTLIQPVCAHGLALSLTANWVLTPMWMLSVEGEISHPFWETPSIPFLCFPQNTDTGSPSLKLTGLNPSSCQLLSAFSISCSSTGSYVHIAIFIVLVYIYCHVFNVFLLGAGKWIAPSGDNKDSTHTHAHTHACTGTSSPSILSVSVSPWWCVSLSSQTDCFRWFRFTQNCICFTIRSNCGAEI
jgi:hypothetical protein